MQKHRILILWTHLGDFSVEDFATGNFEVTVKVTHGVGKQDKSVSAGYELTE